MNCSKCNRYVLSPAARADLEQIWDYTCGRWDDDQAEGYVREIQRAIERVVDNPMIGRACDELRPGYRKHAVGSHTLYYRIVGGDVIDVVRIRLPVLRHSVTCVVIATNAIEGVRHSRIARR